MENNHVVKSHDVIMDAEYAQWIGEVKERFRNTQIKAAVKINSEQLIFNWHLGRDLVVRKAEEQWGNGVVEQLSLDLRSEFPGAKGFGTTNLWYMKKWYLFYSESLDESKLQQAAGEIGTNAFARLKGIGSIPEDSEKLQQAVGEMEFPSLFSYVPWGHHILIITKCKSVEEALFYIKRVIVESLSRSALEDYLQADLYHNAGKALTNFPLQLPMRQAALANEILKSNYDLGFITLPAGYNETALEDAIEHRITRFLLELGSGWAFIGRQKEIIVSGKSRKIDLLFYHIYLRCYVVIELKVSHFEPEFAGKLNFYVNAVDQFIRKEGDNPTIGLLICRDMNQTEVQLAFQGVATPMGVATYSNVRIKEIQAHLPTTEQIQQQVEIAEQEFTSISHNKTES